MEETNITAQEKQFQRSVFQYLQETVKKVSNDHTRQSLLSHLEELRSGLSVDVSSTSSFDIFNLYKLHGPKDAEKDEEFGKYIELLNKKGYFNGTDPGTTQYEARLEKARARFAAKYTKTPEQHKDAGNEFVRQGNYKDALTEYTLAIEGDPSNAIYYANRGLAHQKLLNHEAAVSDLEKAIKITPSYIKTYPRLATSYRTLNQTKKALEIVEMGLAVEPANDTLLALKTELQNAPPAVNGPAGGMPEGFPQFPFPMPQGMPNFYDLVNQPEFMQMAQNLVQNNPEVMQFARQVAENPQLLQQMFAGFGGAPPEGPPNTDM
jgi:tetratricopeptide (TPR) repeat protein